MAASIFSCPKWCSQYSGLRLSSQADSGAPTYSKSCGSCSWIRSPDHQIADRTMSCGTGNPAYHPAPVERHQTSTGPDERQRGPPETSRASSGGPSHIDIPSAIRRGVRGAASKGESAETPNGSKTLHGNSWSISAKPDGGLTSSVDRNTGEEGDSLDEAIDSVPNRLTGPTAACWPAGSAWSRTECSDGSRTCNVSSGPTGPPATYGPAGQQGDSPMGTVSQTDPHGQQQHAGQLGQHDPEPNALTVPERNEKVETTSHTGQRGHLEQLGHLGQQGSQHPLRRTPQRAQPEGASRQHQGRTTSPQHAAVLHRRHLQNFGGVGRVVLVDGTVAVPI